jgi:hypothetical protein
MHGMGYNFEHDDALFATMIANLLMALDDCDTRRGTARCSSRFRRPSRASVVNRKSSELDSRSFLIYQ